MTVTKFTPGPWIAHSDIVFSEPNISLCVALVAWDHKESKANASLIAAAPDMYAALEEACHFMGGGDAYDRWQAVLAKARGEKP